MFHKKEQHLSALRWAAGREIPQVRGLFVGKTTQQERTTRGRSQGPSRHPASSRDGDGAQDAAVMACCGLREARTRVHARVARKVQRATQTSFCWVLAYFEVYKRFSGEAKIINSSRDQFFCSVLEEHDESSRMPVSTWGCALSFGRCRMSKFWLLVYLDFFKKFASFAGKVCVCVQYGTSENVLSKSPPPAFPGLSGSEMNARQEPPTSKPDFSERRNLQRRSLAC